MPASSKEFLDIPTIESGFTLNAYVTCNNITVLKKWFCYCLVCLLPFTIKDDHTAIKIAKCSHDVDNLHMLSASCIRKSVLMYVHVLVFYFVNLFQGLMLIPWFRFKQLILIFFFRWDGRSRSFLFCLFFYCKLHLIK